MKTPVVNTDECIGCGACADMCASDAIVMENDKARILPEKCTNCRVCERTCPVGAIS